MIRDTKAAIPAETTPGVSPRHRQLAAQALISQLLVAHADLADARAVARINGLTRCAEQLARQSGAISAEIVSLVTDIMAPTVRLTEDFR